MKISVDNGDKGQLWDADGNRIPDVREADTETGECVVAVRDENGTFMHNLGELTVVTVWKTPPLIFERYTPNEEETE